MTRALNVVEEFLSFQGEGANVGRLSYFIRLAGCNVHCTFCDTRYSWDKEEMARLGLQPYLIHPDKLVKNIKDSGATMAVITGGEPLLQPGQLHGLCVAIRGTLGKHVEIETNGTVMPIPIPAQYNVSPKVIPGTEDFDLNVLGAHARFNSVFKFVVGTLADCHKAQHFAKFLNVVDNTFLMPLGGDPVVTQKVAEWAKELKMNLGFRAQVLTWGPKRGV